MPKSVLKQPKVVVIDDDQAYLDLVSEVLAGEGYSVVASLVGAGAFELIDREQPNAVILDLRLEYRDSGLIILDVLRLHRRTASVPVLICSADEQFLHEHALAFADHQCLTLLKPFDLASLLQKLRQALALSRTT